MTNPEHLALLKQGVEAWNEWRQSNPSLEIDLTGVDLRRANLCGVALHKADLEGADLEGADLEGAFLRGANFLAADLHGADLRGADLLGATLYGADLRGADLEGAILHGADFGRANLCGALLYRARLLETVFSNVVLAEVKGLDTCHYDGPFTLDFRTLQQSGTLPVTFLRGCGLPDLLIDYLPSLLSQPVQYYSCFISYSSKDEDFAQRLYADLQSKRVRCWFAPEDIQGGRKIYEQLGEAIRLHEKLLLVLSEHSMSSRWVRVEIDKARQREEREKRQVLFPIRLVDYETIEQWECFNAHEIREYFIPDFSNWKSHDAYQQAFERLLRDLKPALERKPETS